MKEVKQVGSFVGSVAIWRTIFSLLTGTLVIGVVLFFVNTFRKNWVRTYAELLDLGNVPNPNCREYINNEQNKHNKCDYKFKYQNYQGDIVNGQINNHAIIPEIFQNGKRYIEIEYNPNRNNDVGTPFPRKTLNIIFVIALIINILMIIFYYVYRNNNIVKGIAIVDQVAGIAKKKK